MYMKNLKKYIGLAAAAFPLMALAQLNIGFETTDTYTKLGVYDAWEESPFRKGLLEGNVKVIANELTQADELLGRAPNATEKILAVQRSRFGSNTFGARIDLAETFELTTTPKYVHVFINKPTAGRVMLIGLGKRRDRAGQSPETEQFWEVSSTKITPDKWCDAVFAIKGAGGIDIHSLVVVPECESPHNLTEDFVAYIDEITFMSTATPRVIYGDYPLNYEENTTLQRSDRYTTGISLDVAGGETQTLPVTQQTTKLLYNNLLGKSFVVKAGDRVTPTFDYHASGSPWMHGYVYLDRGNDGRFDAEMEGESIPEGSDIMTFSHLNGKNSNGVTTAAGTSIQPPAFVVPELPYGYYRMRYKVDWDNIDPAGNNNAGNEIWSNGGAIIDVRLNIHGDEVSISRSGGLNGDILDEDGNILTTKTAPFGQPFTIVAKPASSNFQISYIKVRHGYNLDGDSLVHGTPQYIDEIYPAYFFRDNKFTIPAECIDGDVVIEPYFVDTGLETPDDNDYARNFADDLTISRTDRKLNSFTFTATQGGTTTITIPDGTNYVYRDLTGGQQVSVVPGDAITTAVSYTGRAMHHYLYIDFNNDGKFTGQLEASGVPSFTSELLAYTCYENKNSLGESIATPGAVSVESLPAFVIPAELPAGVYRARFKVDWNNIDPAGNWSEAGNNKINDNGGYVVDFLLNVHNEKHSLELLTENGSLNGANYSALPLTVVPFRSLEVVPTPAAVGYTAEKMTVRHGHNLAGPQYIRGNRQWSEYETDATACTLPADSINGDVVITVNFREGADAEYKLVFSDEFNAPDGTRPDAQKWTCGPRHSSAWNRFIVDDERVAFLQDGKLVLRAIPNPDTEKYTGEMITGAMQSSGGRFGFKYGKLEARLLTNGHVGNFPALWLMPDDQSAGWPGCGEIDIWEQINNEQKAYHTLHTGYKQSMFSRSEAFETDRYHTLGFEWDAEKMIWYLDGKEVARYLKSSNTDPQSWPFDKTFYIIVNQSVGNGSWASNPDVNHVYETRFDWVRVYQKEGQPNITSVASANADGDLCVQAANGCIRLAAARPTDVRIHDLAGRLLYGKRIAGNDSVSVGTGVYVVNGQKVIVP